MWVKQVKKDNPAKIVSIPVKLASPKLPAKKDPIKTLEWSVWMNWKIEYDNNQLFYKINEMIDALNK